MFIVYVLFSKKHPKIYIGMTSDLLQRLASHNEFAKQGWTIRFRPWQLIYTEELETKKLALEREQQLKSAQGRIFIWSQLVPK